MPNYSFRNKKTEEVQTLSMKIAELDGWKEANPDWEQCFDHVVGVCDPIRLGRQKTPDSWRELMRAYKKQYPGSTINSDM